MKGCGLSSEAALTVLSRIDVGLLEELDLSGNELGNALVEWLLKRLGPSSPLRALRLADNPIGYSSALRLLEWDYPRTLRALELKGSQLGYSERGKLKEYFVGCQVTC